MAFVDFFVAGAPKCGTTSLHYYLCQHPGIAMADPKEPHFFGTDMGGYQAHEDLPAYEAMFEGTGDKACGEASVFYLMSADALAQVRDYNPDARIVLILRDPKQMLPSLHAQLVFTQDEDVDSFADAWDLAAEREQGGAVPRRARSMVPLRYRSCAKYGAQVARLKELFDDSQIHIVLFEDFKADVEKSVSEILQFIGVEDLSASFDYKLQNPNTVNRSALLTRALRHPPEWVKTLKRAIVGRGHSKLRAKLLEMNTVARPRDPLPDRIYEEIEAEYRADVTLLSELLGRPLDHWLGVPKT
ncbi:MAG: sulfotransferase domain-containing protein [Rhodobacteraceae bacterium]|nr:sulfotransferase domain-containing protein [Paracoccaceae bacterium]